MTLRRQLLISMLLLAILPLVVASTLMYRSTSELARQEAIESTDRATYNTFHAFATRIDNLYTMSINSVSFPELVRYTNNYLSRVDSTTAYHNADIVKAQLRSFLLSNASGINGIGLYLADQIVHTYELGTAYRNEEVVKAAYQGGGAPHLHIDYDRPRKNGLYPLTISCAYLSTANSMPMGTIVLTISDSIFQDFRNESQWAEGEMYFVLDAENRVVLHPDASLMGTRFTDEAMLGATGSDDAVILSVNGRKSIVRAMQIPRNGWKVFYVIPYSHFNAQPDAILNISLFIALPCAVVALIVAMCVAISVYRPIRTLSKQMRTNARNALGLRVTEAGPLEVRELAGNFNDLMDQIRTLIDEIELQSSMKRDMELAALRAQIMPHFIYNTLNVIKCLAEEGDTTAVQKAAVSLISLLRGSIGSNRDMVKLREDIKYVQNYLYLQKLRLDVHFTFSDEVPEALRDYIVPRFILQPIIENALIHAFDDSDADNRIVLCACKEGSAALLVTVRDNGSGFSDEAREKLRRRTEGNEAYSFNSVGLANVNERIRRLFGPEYGISQRNLEKGSEVLIRLRLIAPIEEEEG